MTIPASTSNVRAQLAHYAPKACPEIYAAFLDLSEAQQERVLKLVQAFSLQLAGVGAVGGLELVYKLARHYKVNGIYCPCCGALLVEEDEDENN